MTSPLQVHTTLPTQAPCTTAKAPWTQPFCREKTRTSSSSSTNDSDYLFQIEEDIVQLEHRIIQIARTLVSSKEWQYIQTIHPAPHEITMTLCHDSKIISIMTCAVRNPEDQADLRAYREYTQLRQIDDSIRLHKNPMKPTQNQCTIL